MKCVKIILFYIFICCVIFDATAQSISVNDSYTEQQLVQDVLVKSSCANVSNITVKGDSFSGSLKSYGYFNAGTSSFPFTEGIVLSTWSSKNSEGPYVSNGGGGNSSWLGDSDLEQALGITNTKNATVLEFDFTALTDFISFDYIFASNEYQKYFPCQYSDGFAFLIKEKGSTANYQNLAVLPNTSPVSSVNVRPAINDFINSNGSVISGCPANNETYFNGYNTATSPINYAGQTTVLTAQTNVIAGKTYHIKLVIADQDNVAYDSAVFLKAGGFLPKIDLGSDRLLASNNPICFGESFNIDTKLPASLGYTYKWYKDNILQPETTPAYTVTGPGIYKVEAQLTSGCIATEEIKIEYAPEIDLNNTTLSQCDIDNDGISIFNLTKVDAIVKNNVSNLSPVVYYETLIDAQGQNNPIVNPTSFTSTTANQVFARVTNSFGCANYAEVDLVISTNTIAVQTPIATCDTDGTNDGLAQFDLNSLVTPQAVTGLPAGLIVEYYLSPTEAIAQQNQLTNIFKNTVATQQIIYARIVNGPDCYAITPITLVVNTFDPPNFQEENAFLCNDTSINLTVDDGFSSYLWSTGASSNTITVTTPGDYSVTVTNFDGCEKIKKYHVTASGVATITGATINDFSGNENSVLIEYTGSGDYEFSIDGSFFQDNPMFNGIASGEYSVYARDKNGCGLSIPFVVYVLDYPRYFTPNGDGYNDVWQIKNLDNLPNSTLFIFDRYGKLLKQLITSDIGWNGTFNGFELPTDDYWFHLNLENGRIIKGHFSLKR